MNEQGRQTGTARTMKASEFRAKCLKLMDEVAETGQEIVITRNGRPVARLTPYRKQLSAPFGRDPAPHPDPGGYRAAHAAGVVRETGRR